MGAVSEGVAMSYVYVGLICFVAGAVCYRIYGAAAAAKAKADVVDISKRL